MARRKFIGEASERSFTFLNDSQDLELSRAMAKVVEKIEMAQYNSDEAKLKRKKEDEEKILFDPKYDYKWWERSKSQVITQNKLILLSIILITQLQLHQITMTTLQGEIVLKWRTKRTSNVQ